MENHFTFSGNIQITLHIQLKLLNNILSSELLYICCWQLN
jgi:hypothetical protein